MIFLTTDDFPGRKIVEVKGVVTSASVQTKNIFKDFGAGFKSIVGGNLSSYEKMVYAAVNEAQLSIRHQAEQLGANAIVGLRYASTNTTAAGSAEIVAYGTAVVVE